MQRAHSGVHSLSIDQAIRGSEAFQLVAELSQQDLKGEHGRQYVGVVLPGVVSYKLLLVLLGAGHQIGIRDVQASTRICAKLQESTKDI